MLRRFVAVFVQMLSGFRKFWCFMIKIPKMIAIAAIDIWLTYQFTFLTPPFQKDPEYDVATTLFHDRTLICICKKTSRDLKKVFSIRNCKRDFSCPRNFVNCAVNRQSYQTSLLEFNNFCQKTPKFRTKIEHCHKRKLQKVTPESMSWHHTWLPKLTARWRWRVASVDQPNLGWAGLNWESLQARGGWPGKSPGHPPAACKDLLFF